MRLRLAAFLPLFLCLAAPHARAEEPLSIVTGPKTGTYIAIGRDIAAVAKESGVALAVKPSGGSIDNIRRINSRENASLGIVQSDVLSFMDRSKSADTARMAERLSMIVPLYREEVHLLARGDIRRFSDLDGKKVVIGEDGSGHMLTAVNLFAMMDVTPSELIKKSPPEGLLALLDQKADAVVFVGGKPVKLFQNLERLKAADQAKYQAFLSDLHFLPLDAPRMLEEYRTAEITAKDYDFVRETVPTIAVTAVLVTYDFTAGGGKRQKERCRQVKNLAAGLRKHLGALQSKGHPKWKEVSFTGIPPIWRKDACAWGDGAAGEKAGKKSLNSDLMKVIRER